MMNMTERMREIRDEVVALTESPLYAYRAENGFFPVIGEGNHDADIMFIGEAPGAEEAKSGRPFCGRSGKLLDSLIEGIGLERSDVYIANVLKDRPPNNRDPLPAEIALYTPFLRRQIEIIEPLVIATLGRFAMNYIADTFDYVGEPLKISSAHGEVYSVGVSGRDVQFVPLYHPAVALYNGSMRSTLEEDFAIIKSLI